VTRHAAGCHYDSAFIQLVENSSEGQKVLVSEQTRSIGIVSAPRSLKLLAEGRHTSVCTLQEDTEGDMRGKGNY
jgi:hypothetical protein